MLVWDTPGMTLFRSCPVPLVFHVLSLIATLVMPAVEANMYAFHLAIPIIFRQFPFSYYTVMYGPLQF